MISNSSNHSFLSILECQICFNLFSSENSQFEPKILSCCGITYCQHCLQAPLLKNCPNCRTLLTRVTMTKNRAIIEMINSDISEIQQSFSYSNINNIHISNDRNDNTSDSNYIIPYLHKLLNFPLVLEKYNKNHLLIAMAILSIYILGIPSEHRNMVMFITFSNFICHNIALKKVSSDSHVSLLHRNISISSISMKLQSILDMKTMSLACNYIKCYFGIKVHEGELLVSSFFLIILSFQYLYHNPLITITILISIIPFIDKQFCNYVEMANYCIQFLYIIQLKMWNLSNGSSIILDNTNTISSNDNSNQYFDGMQIIRCFLTFIVVEMISICLVDHEDRKKILSKFRHFHLIQTEGNVSGSGSGSSIELGNDQVDIRLIIQLSKDFSLVMVIAISCYMLFDYNLTNTTLLFGNPIKKSWDWNDMQTTEWFYILVWLLECISLSSIFRNSEIGKIYTLYISALESIVHRNHMGIFIISIILSPILKVSWSSCWLLLVLGNLVSSWYYLPLSVVMVYLTGIFRTISLFRMILLHWLVTYGIRMSLEEHLMICKRSRYLTHED